MTYRKLRKHQSRAICAIIGLEQVLYGGCASRLFWYGRRSDVMSFMYNSLIDASNIGYTVRWISFSKLGEYLAVGTSRSITVWSVESGAPLAEDLSTQSIDPLCITWVSRLSFVVGTQHGCLYSFEIMVKDKVRLTGQYSHSLRL